MKEYYSVELRANDYNDDTLVSEDFNECVDYIHAHGYTSDDARIAEYLDDGDPIVNHIYYVD